jgi:hypothetical protein
MKLAVELIALSQDEFSDSWGNWKTFQAFIHSTQ